MPRHGVPEGVIAITIGAYELPQFVELNIRSCRNIFGSSPILIYCGAGRSAETIKAIADKFDCSFIYEEKNRGHFAGCVMTAVSSVAFGKHVGSDISIKCNQRLVPLSPDIPDRLEAMFSDPSIDLAMPIQMRAETIHDERSKFHAKFVVLPDFIAFRTSAVDAQSIADAYSEQVRNSTKQGDTLTEMFWAKQVEGPFNGRFAALPWMSEPTEPPIYLRKVQHKEERFRQAAVALGMDGGRFETAEWGNMLGASYRPMPRL